MTRSVLLTAHVAVGTFALLVGPAAMWGPARLSRVARRAYLPAVTAVTITAAALSATALTRLWWLLPVAGATQAAAVTGRSQWHRHGAVRAGLTVHLLGGSYVALVSALLVARTSWPVFWVLPGVLAQWPMAVATRRLRRAARTPAASSPGSTRRRRARQPW